MGDLDTLASQLRSQGRIMKLTTQPVSDQDRSRIRNEIRSGEAYPTLRGRRGRAILVGNTTFTDPEVKPLAGVEFDMTNVHSLFTELKFTCEVWRNKRLNELRQLLDAESKHPDHQDADAFVMFISSHGLEQCILTHDCQRIGIEEIKKYFDGNNCRNLIGKPKLFFVDACQGDNRTTGVDVPGRVTKGVRLGMPSPNTRRKHEKNDIFVFSATVLGYVAYEDSALGSRFTRCLVFVFSNNAHRCHLAEMCTKVKQLMDYLDEDYQQAPDETGNTLLKKCYLLPRQRIQIFVSSNRTRLDRVDVYDNDVASDVVRKVAHMLSMNSASTYLWYDGTTMDVDDKKTLSDYGVISGSTLNVVQRTNGGV